MQRLHLRTRTTHPVLLIHVRTLLDELRNIFGHVFFPRSKERVLAAVLAQHCLHVILLGIVERSVAVLQGAGVSLCVERGHACVRGMDISAHLINTCTHVCVLCVPLYILVQSLS
jgi:hypothetical protein